MFLKIFNTITEQLRAVTGLSDVGLVEGGEHADLASTVAFSLAKTRKQNPALISAELAATLSSRPELATVQVEAKGPYINFVLGPGYIEETLREAVRPGYGTLPVKPGRVVLEHTLSLIHI